MKKDVFVVIPNYNGAEDLEKSVDSVLGQSFKDFDLIIVDNGSTDNSRQIIEDYEAKDKRVRHIYRDKNYGYTGGVNPGFDLAIKEDATYAAPFNNDAWADKDWLKRLVEFLKHNAAYGIATCTILHGDGKTIDSTADQYTIWGIPYPRGRDEPATSRYDSDTEIFGASGGASLYRVNMLQKIGTFDQDFFAYYEDIDLSFRAQLAGYKVAFVPQSVVYHEQGKTAARIAGRAATDRSASPFTTEQFMKNLPFVLVKDIPAGLLWRIWPRFILVYTIFFLKSFTDGRGRGALKGLLTFWRKLPKKLRQRRQIQKQRVVSNEYVWGLLVHDLPPNAHKLRKLRALWRRVTGRH